MKQQINDGEKKQAYEKGMSEHMRDAKQLITCGVSLPQLNCTLPSILYDPYIPMSALQQAVSLFYRLWSNHLL